MAADAVPTRWRDVLFHNSREQVISLRSVKHYRWEWWLFRWVSPWRRHGNHADVLAWKSNHPV